MIFDLATIAVFLQTPNLLVVHPSLPVGYMPEDAARYLRNEIALWTTVVKASGAQVD